MVKWILLSERRRPIHAAILHWQPHCIFTYLVSSSIHSDLPMTSPKLVRMFSIISSITGFSSASTYLWRREQQLKHLPSTQLLCLAICMYTRFFCEKKTNWPFAAVKNSKCTKKIYYVEWAAACQSSGICIYTKLFICLLPIRQLVIINICLRVRQLFCMYLALEDFLP